MCKDAKDQRKGGEGEGVGANEFMYGLMHKKENSIDIFICL